MRQIAYVGAALIVCGAIACLIMYFSRARTPSVEVVDGQVGRFPDVEAGSTVKYVFRVRNEGRATLVIDKVLTGCSCSGVVLPKNRVEPGEEIAAEMRYQTNISTSEEGYTQAVMYTNDPHRPQVRLQLTGRVKRGYMFSPSSVTFLGRAGEGMQKELEFWSPEGRSIQIEGSDVSSERIKTTFSVRGDRQVCTVSLLPSCPKGNWVDQLDVRLRVGESVKSVRVPIYAMLH